MFFFATTGCCEEFGNGVKHVKLADDLGGSINALVEAGAVDITSQVGIKTSYAKSRWLILPDMTCIWLASRDGQLIGFMESGERGKRYGGKEKWRGQRKEAISEISFVKQGEFILKK